MDLDDFSPARLADRAYITEVLNRWARGVDRLDADLMRAAFHPDAIDNHGMYVGNVDGLIDWIQTRHKEIPFAWHIVNNVVIEFAGPDVAIVESLCMTIQHHASASEAAVELFKAGTVGKPLDMLGFGRYADRFERRGGHWKISERTVVYDSQIVTESPGIVPVPGGVVGQRGRGDFIYTLRKQAGLTA